jgi:hypothetical protein
VYWESRLWKKSFCKELTFATKFVVFPSWVYLSLSLSLLSYLSFLNTFSSVVFIFMFLDCLCSLMKTLKRVWREFPFWHVV